MLTKPIWRTACCRLRRSPRVLESEPGVVRLMVPAGLAEQALRLLAAPLSDEELAAQAEAAGFEGEESEAEPEEDPDA